MTQEIKQLAESSLAVTAGWLAVDATAREST
jgi:hypothetical protein